MRDFVRMIGEWVASYLVRSAALLTVLGAVAWMNDGGWAASDLRPSRWWSMREGLARQRLPRQRSRLRINDRRGNSIGCPIERFVRFTPTGVLNCASQ